MFGARAGLKRFVEVIGVKVGFKLSSNNLLKDFGQKGEVGDGPVVVGGARFFCIG